jgi:hypothetical protein
MNLYSQHPMPGTSHFHIKWKESNRFDWQRFETESDASTRAAELVKPGETFSIETSGNDDCPYCIDIRGRLI